MRRRSLRTRHIAVTGGAFAGAVLLAAPAAASADSVSTLHVLGVSLDPMDWLSQGVDKVKDVALGPINFGVDDIGGLIVSLLIAIADLLVPDWLADIPLKLVTWIVAVPDWTATRANGSAMYPGINNLHDYLLYFGVGLMTAGVTFSAIGVVLGNRSPEDLARSLAGAVLGLVFYRYGWDQASALVNTMTDSLLSSREVRRGISQMVAFAGGGAFLAAGTIFLPILAIAAGVALLGLIAAKAALILLSAIVYIFGGFVIASLVWGGPGRALFRMWSSMAAAVFGVPVIWASLFAVSGVLINDAMSAGKSGLVEGGGQFSDLMSAIMLALTGIITLYLAIKIGGAVFGLIKNLPMIPGVPGGMPGAGSLSPSGTPGSGGRPPANPTSMRSELSRLGDTLAGATGAKGFAASAAAGVIPGSLPAMAANFAREGVWGPMARANEARGAGSAGAAESGPTTAPGAAPEGNPAATAGSTAPTGATGAGTAGAAATGAASAVNPAAAAGTAAAGAAGGAVGSAGMPTSATSTAPNSGPLPGSQTSPGSPDGATPTPTPSSPATADATPPKPTDAPAPTPAQQSPAQSPAQGGAPAAPSAPERGATGAQGPEGPSGPAGPTASPQPPAGGARDAHQAASERSSNPTPPPQPQREDSPPQAPRPDARDSDR